MVKVYFESDSHAELVAVFNNEAMYILCLPALKAEAKKKRLIVTESIEEITLNEVIEGIDELGNVIKNFKQR